MIHFDSEADTEATDIAGAKDISYAGLAKSAMEILLENTLTAHVEWTNADKTCPRCCDDDTVGLGQQQKEYTSAANLDTHLRGNFHTPVSEWKRYVKLHCVSKSNKELLECPYCKEARIANADTYKTIRGLVDHVKDSTPSSTSERHDELKANAGWYDEDFQKSITAGVQANTAQASRGVRRRRLLDLGIVLTPGHVIEEAFPHPTIPNVSIGPPQSEDPADLFPQLVSRGLPVRNLDVIPPHLEGIIGKGYPQPFAEDPSIVSSSLTTRSSDKEMMMGQAGGEGDEQGRESAQPGRKKQRKAKKND